MASAWALGILRAMTRPLGDVLQGGLVPEKIVILEDERRLFAQAGNVGLGDLTQVKLLAVKDQGAAVGCFQKVEAAQERGLARAAGAQDGDDIALVDGEVHALEDIQLADYLAGPGLVEDAGLQAGFCVSIKRFAEIPHF